MAIITSVKEVNQLIVTVTVCIVMLIGGLTWICILANRSIKDVNVRSNQQILDDEYRNCVIAKPYDKISECKKVTQ